MKINKFGEVVLDSDDVFKGLYSGSINDLKNVKVDQSPEFDQFNQAVDINLDDFGKISYYFDPNLTIEEFDKNNQSKWFMPKDYCPNLVEFLYSLCETEEQIKRVDEEIELFIQHGMFDLLYYLKYLVDTMRENNVVWGVGRGSSVASYVLYLIGVHKIDSIKYNLDIREFLK